MRTLPQQLGRDVMKFNSGVYRPEEDERNRPKKSVREIVDHAVEAKRRRLGQNYYRTRPPLEMAGVKRATRRMLGEKE